LSTPAGGAKVMVTIESKLIGDFKIGDNINYNLEVLALLYDRFNSGNQQQRRLLCKPIIVLLASIVEAVLYDFHKRVKLFTIEGVQNLAAEAINHIRAAKIDDFAKYIDSAKKQKLFGEANIAFYERMHDVRRLRNRIHIQNEKNDHPRDERDVFTADKKVLAEQVLEKTLRVLASDFARDKDHVAAFRLPWNAHYPE
jgi:hypothetical protein